MMNFDFSSIPEDDTPVVVDGHARKRWRERLRENNTLGHPLNENTWRDAEVVHAPGVDCDEARLYEIIGQRDMLLCGHHHPDRTEVRTVLYADHDRLSRL